MKFRTTLHLAGKTATGIIVPPNVVESLGAGKRPPVLITINGYTYHSTVAVMSGDFMLPVAAEHRVAAGISAGEEIDVDVVLDTAPREVLVPDDLALAMDAAPGTKDKFDSLSYSNRKERVLLVEGAKTPETRQRRIEKVITELKG